MATTTDQTLLEFTEFHLCAGIGGGSLGSAKSRASWLGVQGGIRNIGAIDYDPMACEDYRNFTGSDITCLDLFDRDQYRAFHGDEPPSGWREATPTDVLAAAGGQCPDIVFTSPPCKGFSGLLPNASASSAKYQALNRLTVRSIRLTLEAFADAPPRIFLLENVPRIKSRGAELLDEIKGLLQQHGYVCHDADHDCGEIGGLGQRRRRYLLIARHAKRCKPFVYQPPIRALKSIGDVIGPLPLPDHPSMGPMHRLPRLKWLTWLRLALIPAGGDWRDLQTIAPDEYRLGHEPRGSGPWGVQEWKSCGATITGSASIKGSNAAAISDPRLPESKGSYPNRFGIRSWHGFAACITGDTDVQCGAQSIGDPRLTPKSPKFTHAWKISDSTKAADTVACGNGPSSGGICIDDVRLGHAPRPGVYRVLRMSETSGAIVGGQGVGVSNRPQAVADHRLGCTCRNGSYGVMSWGETASAVIGSADCHAAKAAIADVRIPGNNDRIDPPPVIIALDGTWHRPLTTMELLALQSFPLHRADGTPVVLAGRSDSKWRERIGNAVPPEASRRMHEQILLALLQNALGETFVLGSTAIWVTPTKKPLVVNS